MFLRTMVAGTMVAGTIVRIRVPMGGNHRSQPSFVYAGVLQLHLSSVVVLLILCYRPAGRMSSLKDDSWIQQILELENSDGLEEVEDFDLQDSFIMEMVDADGNVLASWVSAFITLLMIAELNQCDPTMLSPRSCLT